IRESACPAIAGDNAVTPEGAFDSNADLHLAYKHFEAGTVEHDLFDAKALTFACFNDPIANIQLPGNTCDAPNSAQCGPTYYLPGDNCLRGIDSGISVAAE